MNSRPSVFQRLVCAVLCVSLSMPNIVYAQASKDPSVIGREGQAFGRELLQDYLGNQPTLEGNNLNLPDAVNGPLNIQDLFPGSSSTYSGNAIFFPDGYSTNVDEYTGIHDSGSAMDSSGSAAQGALWDDATKDDPVSIQGQAYKVILDTANRSRPDMRKDPIFNQSRDVMDDIGEWQKEFGDCSTKTVYSKDSREVHIPEYERCERVIDKSKQCELIHDYDAAVVKHHDGPFNLDSCGDGCTSLWIGQVGDNYWSGWCSIHEQQTSVTVVNPDAITSAVLEYVEYDDYMQVWVGPIGQEEKIFNGPNENFPPETGGACELETSWKQSPGIDVTKYFKNVEEGQPVNFKIRVSVSGEGEGFGRIRINYDPNKTVTKDEWHSEECLQAAIGVVDGFATGDFICVDDPGVATPDGCTFINGVRICSDMLKPSPLPGISNTCTKVHVEATYDFYKGQMDCYTDTSGELQCPNNDGGQLNSCTTYENNPQCGYIKSTCIDGAKGPSGECYVFEDTYDCGHTAELGTIRKDLEIECAGPIRCMGTDCLDISYTENNDFAKAAAMLNAAQFMAQDMACTGQDEEGKPTGDEDVICSVFPGDAGECKKAVGGAVNCCEKPEGISLIEYVTLLMAVPKIDTAIMGLSETNAIRSSYQLLREPITQGFTELSQPFTNAIDSVSGVFDTVSQAYDQVVGQFQEAVANLYDTVFGNVASSGSGAGAGAGAGAIASEGAQTAGEQFVQNAGQLIGWVGTIYTVYSVSMMAIKMIWKCTEDELAINVKRQLKSCNYVGSYCKTEVLGVCIEKRESYCCYSSPLSRIIQEQVRPQLGLTFGSPKSPSCGGITMEQIGEVDWEKVNLDEWLGLLQSTGHWPNPDEINIDTLTGAGTTFDLGSRVNAEERALKRLEGTDIDQARYDQSITYKPFTGGAPSP